MSDSALVPIILCPHCHNRYQEANLPAASICPICGQSVDVSALNVFSTGAGVLYMDYTIYPDLILSHLPPLDTNPAAVYLYRLTSERSRAVMGQSLRIVAALLTGQDARSADILALRWEAVRYPHTIAVRTRLGDIYSPATANRILSALRGVLKEAWRLGLMSAEDFFRAADIGSIRGETVPTGRELSTGEILALVTACKADTTPAGVRDAAIIGLLYTCGLRRAEIVALAVADFDTGSGRLLVRAGKGRRQRTVCAQGGALRALQDWLALRGNEAGALFVPVNKGGRLTPRPMSAQTIYDLLKKRAGAAGVTDFSPHDLRRTFVGETLERGVDAARRDGRPEETKKKAARRHFPY